VATEEEREEEEEGGEWAALTGREGAGLVQDRGSIFQAALVSGCDSLPAVAAAVAAATAAATAARDGGRGNQPSHSPYAYRLCEAAGRPQEWGEGSYDDGEGGVGTLLLNELRRHGATNVCIVAHRWFGGIMLGAARFAHFRAVGRQLLSHRPLRGEIDRGFRGLT
jgi:hypothetical protein